MPPTVTALTSGLFLIYCCEAETGIHQSSELASGALQAGAFADYQPGEGGDAAASGGGDGGDQAAESKQSAPPQEAPSSGGSSGSFPPHIVLNMPALSPTMSAGASLPMLVPAFCFVGSRNLRSPKQNDAAAPVCLSSTCWLPTCKEQLRGD